MGKVKKLKHLKMLRNAPLERQLEDDAVAKQTGRIKERKRNDEEEKFINPKLSKKILSQARKQQAELEDEFVGNKNKKSKKKREIIIKSDSNDELDDDDNEANDKQDDIFYEDIQIDNEDEKALELFMNKNEAKRKTLADYIQEKLREKETEVETQFSDNASVKVSDLDEKVVELYQGVKQVLAHYRSGKLPKAFKIIPALSNWEQILQLTDPDSWTAAAMYQATRIFTANLKEKMAQRFFNLILLPRLRDDILEYKTLNFHLYQALTKSLFKPGAFFKGIVLPLCESGDCTLREAVIISSVIGKHHIPILHSCAAMLKIAEMDYTGANSVFLHTLIKKKYALPYRVVDGIVYHFLKFVNDKRTLPVLWHQCLLIFLQNYKQDVSSEQKEALFELLRVHNHHQITQEIRNLLLNSKCRDEEVDNVEKMNMNMNNEDTNEDTNMTNDD